MNSLDKLRAIVLIEIKILVKYENFIAIVLSDLWGTSNRSKFCRKYFFEYMEIIDEIVEEGIKKGEIINADANVISSGIFGFIGTSLIYKLRKKENNQEIEVLDLFKEIDKSFVSKLTNK